MTLHEYIEDMRGKRIAIIGIGVSNAPLLKLLAAEGLRVAACDKRTREQMGQQAEDLERLGCELHLGPDYLKDLEADVIEENGRVMREFIHILKNGRAIGHLDITGLEAAQIEALLRRVCTGWVGGGAG